MLNRVPAVVLQPMADWGDAVRSLNHSRLFVFTGLQGSPALSPSPADGPTAGNYVSGILVAYTISGNNFVSCTTAPN